MTEEEPKEKTRMEQRDERNEIRREAMEKLRAESGRIRTAIDEVLRTPAGRELFAHLYRFCGFDKTSLSIDHSTGGVDLTTTGLNEARRGVYIHLRELATGALIAPAEQLAESHKGKKGD